MQNKQHKIDFIIEKCGGDSLSHMLENIPIYLPGTIFWSGFSLESTEDISYLECGFNLREFSWQLLIDNKEARLQDQSEETISQIATILGYENE